MTELYESFRPVFILALTIHLLGLAPQWFRYVGPEFDSSTLLSTKLRATLALIIPTSLALFGLFVPFALLLLPIYLLLWYVHWVTRFESLARGAGAVGFVPQALAFFLVISDLGLSFSSDSDQFLFFSSFALTLFWAGLVINAGLVKVQEGYYIGLGLQSFLSNPFWGRFWRYFQQKPLGGSPRMVLGRLAIFAEVLGGSLLLVPGFSQIGALIVLSMFLFIGIFIKLYSLPWISVAVTSYLFIWSEIFVWDTFAAYFAREANFDVLSILTLACFITAFGLSQIVGATLVGIEFLGFRSEAIFQMQSLRFLQVFRWRVFTYDVISTCVTFHEDSLRENWNMEGGYKLARAVQPLLAQASEVVALSSVFNTVKSQKYWTKFPQRLRQYLRSTPFKDTSGFMVMWVCFEDFGQSDWRPLFVVSCESTKAEIVGNDADLERVIAEEFRLALSRG